MTKESYNFGVDTEAKRLYTETSGITAKRFIGNFQGDMLVSINDNESNKRLNILQIVEIANQLNDENEELKQLLDYADDLIQSYMSVHNRDEWENVKKNITGDVE